MADVPRPVRPTRGRPDRLSDGKGYKSAGVPAYHDYRQGRINAADCCKTSRPPVPEPPVGAGSGFKGH